MGVFMLGLPHRPAAGLLHRRGNGQGVRLVASAVRDRHDPGPDHRASHVHDPRAGARRGRNACSPAEAPIANPIRKVLAIRTMWWIILAGIAANFAAYATNAFMVPLMQRFFGLAARNGGGSRPASSSASPG